MEKLFKKLRVFIRWFYEVITLPFTKNLKLFCVLLILSAMPIIINVILGNIRGVMSLTDFNPAIKTFLDYFAECWIITMIYSLFQFMGKWPALIWKWSMLTFTSIVSVLDVVCLNALGTSFVGDFILLIRATNAQESSEFISFYFTPIVWFNIIFTFAIMSSMIYGVLKLDKILEGNKYVAAGKVSKVVSLIILLCGLGYQKYMEMRGTLRSTSSAAGWKYAGFLLSNQNHS